MAISKRTRYEVLRRDNNTCRYCHATDTPLTIDHVTPTALGGSDDPSNLVAACKDCNAGKSSSNPDAGLVAQVSDDAIRWAAAMQEASRRAAEGDAAVRERLDAIRSYWDATFPFYKQERPKYRLPSDWTQIIQGLMAAGLPDGMVLDSIDVAAGRAKSLDNVFRYMLGVANNKLAKLQEEAAAIVAADSAKPKESPEAAAYWQGYVGCLAEPDVALSRYNFWNLSRVVDGPKLGRVSA